MNAKKLIKGKVYWYTAGPEWVEVEYRYPTVNGYMFSHGEIEKVMSGISVKYYIEEVNEELIY